jgi:hypothetical protein
MNRTWRPWRRPKAFFAVILTLLAVLGCDKRQNTLSGIGAGNLPPGKVDDPCATHQTGCACSVEGATVACGSVKEKVDNYVICTEGVRTCSGGQWSDCAGDHEEKKPLSFRAPMQGGYTAQALGMSASCDDLCDPGCQNFNDDANGLNVDVDLTASPDGVSLPGGGGGDTCDNVTLTPSTATVTVTAIATDGTITATPNNGKVDFNATCTGGVSVEPSWTIDSYDRAVIDAHGVVTVYSGRGGPIKVTGTTSGDTDVATLNVNVKVGDPIVAAGTTTEPGKTLYPYNNTVFPLGLKAPLVQWTEGGITPTQTEVILCYPQNSCDSGTAIFQYAKQFPTSTAPAVPEPRDGPLDATVPAWQIPQEIWSAFDQTAAGDVGQIIIRRQAGSTKYKQLTINVNFATDALRGTVYYTQYLRALHTTATGQTFTYSGSTYAPGQTCEVGNTTHPSSTSGSQTRAIDLSNSQATNTDPFAKGKYSAGCPVCHSVSADGSTAVSGGQNWQLSGAPSPLPTGFSNSLGVDKIGLDSTGAPMFTGLFAAPNYSNTSSTETSGEDSRGFSYAAISPDGGLVLQAPYFWGSTQSTPAANNTQNGDVTGVANGRKLYFFADTKVPNPGFAVQFATTAALPAYTGACSGSGATYSCTLTASTGTLTIDGQSMSSTSYSVLVKNETGANAQWNGVYTVSSTTSPWKLKLRSDAASTTSFLPQTEVRVIDGNANRGNVYYVSAPTSGTITPGGTALTFSQRIYPPMLLGGTTHTANYATTAALSPATVTQSGNVLTAGAPGYLIVDGHTLALGETVLVKDQANGAQNGTYKMTTAGGAGSGTATAASYATTTALPANTNTNGVLTGSAYGPLPSIDGVTPAVGDAVLVKDEANQANNGVYTVTTLGATGSGTPLAGVVCATTAALPANANSAGVLTASSAGSLGTLDGCTLAIGSRVLVKNEATQANNGVYTVTALGAGGTGAHTAAKVGTTTALPANTNVSGVLTGTSWGPLGNIDGVGLVAGDRVLVMNEATQANNGIYTVTSPGTGTSTVRTAAAYGTTAALPANTNTAGVLTATNYGGLGTIDGMPVNPGDRVLVMNEATQANNGIYTVTNPGTGTSNTHAASRVGTTAALPANSSSGGVLTATNWGALPAIDGQTLAAGDRIVVMNETAAANNGIYTVTSAGTGNGTVHTAVRVSTTAALPANTAAGSVLSATGFGGLVVDGVTLATGDRVLVKNEVTQANNGVFTVTNPGTGTGATHTAARVATTGALPANTNSGGVLTATNWGVLPAIDGVSLAVNDRVLVKDETTQANNGIYAVTNLGMAAGASHTAVRAATTASLPANTVSGITLTATGSGALTVDGVALVANDRVLVKNEVTQANNGIYTVTNAGTGTTNTHTAVIAATSAALPAYNASGGVLTSTSKVALGATGGVTLTAGQRLLVKNETVQANNGIYVVTTVGNSTTKWVLTRDTDAATTGQLLPGDQVPVTSGSSAGLVYYISSPTAPPITINSTSIVFSQSVKWVLTRASDGDVTGDIQPSDLVPVTSGTVNTGATYYVSSPSSGTITIGTTAIGFSLAVKWTLTRTSDANAASPLAVGDLVPVTSGVLNANVTYYVSIPASGAITMDTTAIGFAASSKWVLTRAADTLVVGDQFPVTSGTVNANSTYYLSTPASGAIVVNVTALGFSLSSKWSLTRAADANATGLLLAGDQAPITSGTTNGGKTFYVSTPATGTLTVGSTAVGFSLSAKWVLTRATDANTTGQLVGGDQVPVTGGTTNGGKTFYVSSPASGGAITFNTTGIAFSLSSKWILTRATDADATGELNPGDQVPVTSGTTNGNKTFYVSTPATGTITINTTAIGFSIGSKWVLTRASDATSSAQVFPGLQVPVTGGTTNIGKTFYISSPATGTITVNTTAIVFSQETAWQLTRKSPYDAAGGGLVPGLQVSVSGGTTNGGKTYYISSPMSGTITVNTTGITFGIGQAWQLTRTTDADTTGEITPGQEVSVANGASNAGRVFYVASPTSGTITINTTAISYSYGLPSMMAPVISPDGTKVAYVNGDQDVDGGFSETGWRRGLSMLTFAQSSMTLSNKKRLLNNWNATTPGMPLKWPFFEGDSRSLLYVETDPNEFCSADANNGKCTSVPTDTYAAAVCTGSATTQSVDTNLERSCFNAAYGSMSPTTRGFWPGRIYSIDTSASNPTTTRVELSKLDDAEDTADADKAYQPTVLPFTAGGKRWVIFTSPRSYGNQFNQRGSGGTGTPTDFSCGASMLWVAALDDATANGTDRSHPAFFMPGQQVAKITTTPHYVNERGYLVPSPCKSTGTSCSVDEECCGSSASPATAACRAPVGWDPSTGAPAKTCQALSGTCSNAGQSCATGADCCNSGSCVNFVCAGGGHYTAATFTREYVASCASGQLPVWQLYSYHLTTGSDSQLVFSAQASNDLSTLDSATVVPLGSSSGDTVSPNPPETIDVGAKLDAAGISKNLVNLRILVKLVPSTDGLTAPVLHDWQMRYTCTDQL